MKGGGGGVGVLEGVNVGVGMDGIVAVAVGVQVGAHQIGCSWHRTSTSYLLRWLRVNVGGI